LGCDISPKCEKVKILKEYSVTIISFFCWKKIVNFGEKKDLERNSTHLDFDFDFIFGDLHFLN
jgi:hypothetical protein